MNEIVVISGKGGTGKTSIASCFAALSRDLTVVADCDVDAADLFLVLNPDTRHSWDFVSGNEARIDPKKCRNCGACVSYCRFGAIQNRRGDEGSRSVWIDPSGCEGCGVCVRFCPMQAIDFPDRTCGTWFISDTRFGPMVHARLHAGAENSGKLVTLVRNQARRIAEEQGKDTVIIDGSPGIGCPVIASLTAAQLALIVTEPTVSGEHDLARIVQLTKRLGVPAMVCVNKWDINSEVTSRIRRQAEEMGIGYAGVIRYDSSVTEAQMLRKTVVEHCTGAASDDITKIWQSVRRRVDPGAILNQRNRT